MNEITIAFAKTPLKKMQSAKESATASIGQLAADAAVVNFDSLSMVLKILSSSVYEWSMRRRIFNIITYQNIGNQHYPYFQRLQYVENEQRLVTLHMPWTEF